MASAASKNTRQNMGDGYGKGKGTYTAKSLSPAMGGSNLSHPTAKSMRPITSTTGKGC